jgi:DNA-binding NarL/FixJ family response regulator
MTEKRGEPTADVLSPHEVVIADLMLEGWSDLEIERRLGCAGQLVKRLVNAIVLKLEVRSRKAAVAKWRKLRADSKEGPEQPA